MSIVLQWTGIVIVCLIALVIGYGFVEIVTEITRARWDRGER